MKAITKIKKREVEVCVIRVECPARCDSKLRVWGRERVGGWVKILWGLTPCVALGGLAE